MSASMWSLSHKPVQQKYSELPRSLPFSSTCRWDAGLIRLEPTQCACTFAKCRCLCCLHCRPLCRHSTGKSVLRRGNESAVYNRVADVAHQAVFGKRVQLEQCMVWVSSGRRMEMSSADYPLGKAASMRHDMSEPHGNTVEPLDNASLVKDIEHIGEQCDACEAMDITMEHQFTTEARIGLAEVLCNSGLSPSDAGSIASNAPITVNSIVSEALELDEFATWINQQPARQQQDFKEKIIELANANRSRQFSALMESIGIGERHISRVCHVLAAHSVTDVLRKIRLLEDAFPNEKNDVIVLRTRRMMREMSLSADGGLQRTLSLFEKMEARRGGIGVLSTPREAMPHVIEEFPQILVRDLDSDLKALDDYFEGIGVPKENIPTIYMCFPSILLYRSLEELQSRLRTLKKEINVRPRNFGRMVVKYPWILSRCVEDNVKAVASLLLSAEVPPGKVGECITRCPNLLGSSTTSLQAMVEQLVSIGVKMRTVGKILRHYPQLLLKTPRSFLEIVNYLTSWGLEENDISRILVRCPPVFASTVPHLRKKITFLQQLGIRNHRMKSVLQRYPEVLMLSLENSLKPRLWFLQSMGLTNQDIAFMVCGFPPLLGYSIESVLKPKLDALQHVLRHPVKEVVSYPRYFSYCLEKKILPRYRILKRRSDAEWDLKSMLSPSDDQFAEDHLGFRRMLVPPV